MKLGFARQFAPQVQVNVLDAAQYPALAKNEYGVNESISAVETVVIDCRRTISATSGTGAGAADAKWQRLRPTSAALSHRLRDAKDMVLAEVGGRGTEWMQRAERAGASAGASADARYRQAGREQEYLSESASERTLWYPEGVILIPVSLVALPSPVTHMCRSICRSRGAASSVHAVLSGHLVRFCARQCQCWVERAYRGLVGVERNPSPRW